MKEADTNQLAVINQSSARRSFPWLLAIGDWLVLLFFVVIGQVNHNMLGVEALSSLAITALSVAVPWTVVSFLLGGYRPETAAGFWAWIGRSLTIWLVAAPLGLMLRALILGHATIVLVFMIVLLAVGGVCLIGWRAFYWWWVMRPLATNAG